MFQAGIAEVPLNVLLLFQRGKINTFFFSLLRDISLIIERMPALLLLPLNQPGMLLFLLFKFISLPVSFHFSYFIFRKPRHLYCRISPAAFAFFCYNSYNCSTTTVTLS
eukprot:gene4194-3032_t